MADMIVSGAGTSDVNGTYVENGTYNSKTQWIFNTSYYIRWNYDPDEFYLCWTISGGGAPIYFSTDTSAVSPDLCSSWNIGYFADTPAPTVTAASSGTTHEGEATISSLSYLRSWKYRTQWWLAGGIAAANCVAAYQPKGAADITAAKVNLNNPGTNNAITTGTVGWNVTDGLTISADGNYITMGTYSSFADSNMCAIIRFSNYYNVLNHCLMGVNKPRDWFVYGTDLTFWGGNTGNPIITSGVLAMNGVRMYQNGYATGNADGTPWSGKSSTRFRICYGDGYFWGRVYTQAFSFYNRALSDAEVLAVSTAMAAL